MAKFKSKINLGSGPGQISAMAYTHIDASRKLLMAKIPFTAIWLKLLGVDSNTWDRRTKFRNVNGLRFKENSLSCVYSSHLLEHLYFSDAVDLISHLYFSLEEGGLIRLVLPDYDAIIKEFVKSSIENPGAAMQTLHDRILSFPKQRPSFLAKLRQIITGDLHVHRWLPNFAIVESLLRDVGFKEIKRMEYRESLLEEIELLEKRDLQSFYIEAHK